MNGHITPIFPCSLGICVLAALENVACMLLRQLDEMLSCRATKSNSAIPRREQTRP